MTTHEWLVVVSVWLGLFLGLPLIRLLAGRLGASPEVARKTIHVAMGMSCVAFPWLFSRALPVWVIAVVATVLLVIIRVFPKLKNGVGSSLHGIERLSYGEILFAPAVALVFSMAAGDRYLYIIPILILTIADAAGALGGTRWGKRRYGSGEGFKTVEGSVIFWFTAVLCGFLPLMLGERVDGMHALWIGLILGLVTMMAEGISDRGFDNLVIPVGCFFMLEKLLSLEVPSLVGRFVVLVILLVLVLVGSRWSTLSGGALLGSILLGYGCAVMADWRFALPPVAVFVCHLVTTRRHRLMGEFDHRLDAVLSLAIACLPWVIAAQSSWVPVSVALAGVSFAMGTQVAILDTATRRWLGYVLETPLRSVAKGFLLASVPGLIWLWREGDQLLLPLTIAIFSMGVVVVLIRKIHLNYRGHITWLWMIEGLLALVTSTSAFLL